MHVATESKTNTETVKGKKTTVKAIVIEEYGGPEVLKLKDVDIADPGPGQALVRIAMAGVNFMDIHQRRGIYPRNLPFVPGLEAAGVVELIGESITNVKPGDRVAYTGQPGAYAQASVVQANSLIPLPQDFSFEQGAEFPPQGMTAHSLVH